MTLPDEDPLEPWPDFIRRATRTADACMAKLNIQEWTKTYLQRKWAWAARTAKHSNDRWTQLATAWDPQYEYHKHAQRAQARPRRRWDDDINTFLEHHYTHSTTATATQAWTTLAKDRFQWQTLEKAFINFTFPQITTTTQTNDQQNGDTTTTQ